MRTEVWFEKIERAVHRVRQRDSSLTATQALSQALEDDAEARALYDRHCAPKRNDNATAVDREHLEHGRRVDMRASSLDWSAGGVLLEVAKLRSLKSGTFEIRHIVLKKWRHEWKVMFLFFCFSRPIPMFARAP